MKKVFKTIGNILAWILLIFALLITILVFSADRNNGVPSLLGYIPLTVESDSMKPTFEKDDMIICREVSDMATLENGDVITFWTIIDGKRVKNTHRIVDISNNNGSLSFVTRGDANSVSDDISVYGVDVIGKWTNVRIGGFGKIMSFLRTPKGFFICILLPIIVFFLIELYRTIAVIVELKHPEPAAISAEAEEEIKRRAVEEYLAQQKNAENENSAPENKDQ